MTGLSPFVEAASILWCSFVDGPLWPQQFLELLITKQEISEVVTSHEPSCIHCDSYLTFCSVSCCLISSWDTAISLWVSNVCSTSVIQSNRRRHDSLNWRMKNLDRYYKPHWVAHVCHNYSKGMVWFKSGVVYLFGILFHLLQHPASFCGMLL